MLVWRNRGRDKDDLIQLEAGARLLSDDQMPSVHRIEPP